MCEIETKLESLFEAWKQAHKEEKDEDYEKYRAGKICKSNFLPDGIINEEDYNQRKKEHKAVLFIGKEANWFGDREGQEDGDSTESDGGFWLRDVVVSKENDETMFSNRLAMMINAYITGNYQEVCKNHERLKGCAFMNLNKRGGYSASNWITLDGYAKAFHKYIKQEIALIEPDLIVCCGHDVLRLINEIKMPEGSMVIAVYHPSYFALSDQDYLEQFRCALCGEVWRYQKKKPSNENVNVSVKGIMIDTNKSYSDTATLDMISSDKISAYDEAGKYIDRFNVGDIVFYYVKEMGVVAAGRIISDTEESDYYGSAEKYRTVERITPINQVNSENDLRAISPSEIKTIFEHGFYWASTIKVPYLDENQCDKLIRELKKRYGENNA